MHYEVEIEYTIPQFTLITVESDEAKTSEEARTIAIEEFDKQYPEALEIEIVSVNEIN
jgi:hypothetical protein